MRFGRRPIFKWLNLELSREFFPVQQVSDDLEGVLNPGIDLHSLYSDLDAVQRRQDEMQNLLSSALRLLQERAIRPLGREDAGASSTFYGHLCLDLL